MTKQKMATFLDFTEALNNDSDLFIRCVTNPTYLETFFNQMDPSSVFSDTIFAVFVVPNNRERKKLKTVLPTIIEHTPFYYKEKTKFKIMVVPHTWALTLSPVPTLCFSREMIKNHYHLQE